MVCWLCGLDAAAGWAGDTMNYSFSSPTETADAAVSLNNSAELSDVNSETEENQSGVKGLNTT